jgi:oligopeptide transport system ATP-binding protein
MRLVPSPPGRIVRGSVLLQGQEILSMSEDALRRIRGNRISMIFQDPMTSLNPFLRVSTQLVETIMLHQGLTRPDALDAAVEMLQRVGIPAAGRRIRSYPHQFSGGMRQRVMIAMALSCNPRVLIADEPTTALDVTIQAQILDLLKKLSAEMGAAVILITHDLGVVAGMCDRVCVMYAGRIVERGETGQLFADPKHPYTRALLKSIPRVDASGRPGRQRLHTIRGQPPSLIDMPDCCPFYPRCDSAMDLCRRRYPPETRFDETSAAHCWLYSREESR